MEVSDSESHMDENLWHAKQIRKQKNNKTDFTVMLDGLVDKVKIYKSLFMGKEPKFIQKKEEAIVDKSPEEMAYEKQQ